MSGLIDAFGFGITLVFFLFGLSFLYLIVYRRRKLFGRKAVDEEGEVGEFRIVRGGGTFIWPAWESFERLSLKKADIRKQVDVADAEAVKAGEMEMKLQDIRIAEREVDRQKLELNATVRERADAQRYEVEQTAAARYRRLTQRGNRIHLGSASSSLILASGSPRRREILNGLGLRFTVRPVDIDETPLGGEQPAVHVGRLATEKARAEAQPGEVILAADTVVVRDGEILGKPRDAAHAREMLASICGRAHTVFTGVALYDRDHDLLEAAVETTRVEIAPLTQAQIDWYVDTGEPLDKAGSYAIQGLGSLFVESVEGNYTNVVGLPVPLVARLFGNLGHELLDFRSER